MVYQKFIRLIVQGGLSFRLLAHTIIKASKMYHSYDTVHVNVAKDSFSFAIEITAFSLSIVTRENHSLEARTITHCLVVVFTR